MTMEIQVAQSGDAAEWNSLVANSPQGTVFHTWEWLKIIEHHTASRLYPLIGMNNGSPAGIIPLFYQKKGPIKMVFSPPPHTALFYLGPAFIAQNTRKREKTERLSLDFQKLFDGFIAENLPNQYTHISLAPANNDPRPFLWSGYDLQPHFDYTIDLSPGPDALFSSLDKRQRQDLRRAKTRDMTFGVGEESEYKKILDLMDARYSQQGKIVTVPKSYFMDLFKKFKNEMFISAINFGGEVATGLIHLKYRDTMYCWVGNPKPVMALSPSPNDLLLWESIRYASENGFHYYSIMSAAGNERLHSFYAAKCNPTLSIRYVATKKSLPADVIEKGYLNLIKPLRGKVTSFNLRKFLVTELQKS